MLGRFTIDYSVSGFSAHWPQALKDGTLSCRWGDLVRAAVSVGYDSWADVWKHGALSFFHAIHRVSLLSASFRLGGGASLIPTALFSELDASEKAVGSYHIGMAIASLTADRLLGVPWLQHVDRFGGIFTPALGRSERPDLIGRTVDGRWVLIEAKGRQRVTTQTKKKAKAQVMTVGLINGAPPAAAAISIAGIYGSGVRAVLEDPPSEGDRSLDFGSETYLASYYQRLSDIMRPAGKVVQGIFAGREYDVCYVEPVDIAFGVLSGLLEGGRARREYLSLPTEAVDDSESTVSRLGRLPVGFEPARWAVPSLGRDGTLILLGARWENLAQGAGG